jgi:hypothetical protein
VKAHRHAHLDAAYVLGALSPTERQDFEGHLSTCSDCARSVRELAGLPGLLSRLTPEEVLALGEQPPVPATVLPGLLEVAARRQRRRRVAAVLAGVGSVAAAVLVTLALVEGPESPAPTPPGSGGEVVTGSMRPLLDQKWVRGDLRLEQVAWGTRMSVRCSYRTPPKGVRLPVYALVVHTRSGHAEQVATWRPVPGRVTTVDAATAERDAQIASVEVMTKQGRALLRLTRPEDS